MMIILYTMCIAHGGSVEDENTALREAIDEFIAENKQLKLENVSLRNALDSKDKALASKDKAISGLKVVLDIKDNIISLNESRIDAAEDLISTLDTLYEKERKSKNIGRLERTLWFSAVIGSIAIGAYGQYRRPPLVINTTNAGQNERRYNNNGYSYVMRDRGWSIPIIHNRW